MSPRTSTYSRRPRTPDCISPTTAVAGRAPRASRNASKVRSTRTSPSPSPTRSWRRATASSASAAPSRTSCWTPESASGTGGVVDRFPHYGDRPRALGGVRALSASGAGRIPDPRARRQRRGEGCPRPARYGPADNPSRAVLVDEAVRVPDGFGRGVRLRRVVRFLPGLREPPHAPPGRRSPGDLAGGFEEGRSRQLPQPAPLPVLARRRRTHHSRSMGRERVRDGGVRRGLLPLPRRIQGNPGPHRRQVTRLLDRENLRLRDARPWSVAAPLRFYAVRGRRGTARTVGPVREGTARDGDNQRRHPQPDEELETLASISPARAGDPRL